jgi:hypothetical protein
MKKAKHGKPGSAKRAGSAEKHFDEYLARVPEPARPTLGNLRAAIRSVLPTEATISCCIPSFRYKQVRVCFAAFSDRCSCFPTAAWTEEFKSELKGLGTRFPSTINKLDFFNRQSSGPSPSFSERPQGPGAAHTYRRENSWLAR